MVGSIYLAPNLNGHPNWTEPFVLSGYCSLVLFPKSHRVRHRIFNKINSFDYMMDSSEKHWRVCKRGALPTEL